MNKFFVLMMSLLVISCVFVSAQMGQNQTSDQQNASQQAAANPDTAENLTHLADIVQQKQQEMEQQITQNMDDETKLTIRNQNRVRLTVQTISAMRELVDDGTGGTKADVAAIADGFNNSLQTIETAEERIQKRSAFTRFFVGGDEEAAEAIEAEVNQNRERIQELNNIMSDCDCNSEVKNRLQTEIQNLEQEQNRLQDIADEEKQSKGLFGWIL